MFKRRQNVFKSFRFEEVRPVPYHVWYDDDIAKRMAKYYNDPKWHMRINNYILRIHVEWEPRRYISQDRYIDLHGTEWQEGNPPHIVSPGLKKPHLKGYNIPSYVPYLKNPALTRCGINNGIIISLPMNEAMNMINSKRNEVFTVSSYGNGIFQQACDIRGWENFFSDLILESKFITALLEIILERQLELLDVLLELPCDAIIFADDWADQRGIMMGPELWRKFIKPRAKCLYDKVHSAGKMVFQHVCGNVFYIIPDLIDIGLDCLQSLQPEAMPVYEIKRCYGHLLRLWGGLGTQQLLPFGTPKEIRSEVRRLKDEMGTGGGYIFSSSKPIMREVPIENAVSFIEETIKQ